MPLPRSPLILLLPALFICAGCTGVVAVASDIAIHTLDLDDTMDSDAQSYARSKDSRDPALDRLRVLTYNIHHGADVHGELSLDRIAATIRRVRPDLALLNEVDRFWPRSAHADQPLELAMKTGMNYYVYAPSFTLSSTPHRSKEYGNALLSRFPIVRAERHALPTVAWREPRSVLVAEIDVNGTHFTVMATHLGLDQNERALQAEALLEIIRQRATEHLILAGDFNAQAHSPEIAALQERLGDTASMLGKGEPTFPFPRPTARIDYIFAAPQLATRVVRHETPYVDGSDHLPVVVEFDLGNGIMKGWNP